jgi:hypothetical protein
MSSASVVQERFPMPFCHICLNWGECASFVESPHELSSIDRWGEYEYDSTVSYMCSGYGFPVEIMEAIGAAQSGCQGCDIISRIVGPYAESLGISGNVVRLLCLRRSEEDFVGTTSAIAATILGPITFVAELEVSSVPGEASRVLEPERGRRVDIFFPQMGITSYDDYWSRFITKQCARGSLLQSPDTHRKCMSMGIYSAHLQDTGQHWLCRGQSTCSSLATRVHK